MACHGILFNVGYDTIQESCYKINEINRDDFKSVKSLTLNYCNIESIKEGCFEGLEHLESLFLDYNKIKHLKSNQFKELNSLKTLWLHCCQIETLADNCFTQLSQLEDLALNLNRIQRLDSSQFFDLKELRSLWVSSNVVFSRNGRKISQHKFELLLNKLNNRGISYKFY